MVPTGHVCVSGWGIGISDLGDHEISGQTCGGELPLLLLGPLSIFW